MTLGDRLKKARTNKGLTLEEAGNLIGTTKQNIYKYENGKELVVTDGNTFIQIQPKGEALTLS